jgi:hypothetical protein
MLNTKIIAETKRKYQIIEAGGKTKYQFCRSERQNIKLNL